MISLKWVEGGLRYQILNQFTGDPVLVIFAWVHFWTAPFQLIFKTYNYTTYGTPGLDVQMNFLYKTYSKYREWW